jgi:hypothetical protein
MKQMKQMTVKTTKLPLDRTIIASALTAGTIFSGLFIRSLVKDRYTPAKSDSD